MATLSPLSKTYATLRNSQFPDVTDANLRWKSYGWLLKEALLGLRTNGGTQGGTRTANSKWTAVQSTVFDGSVMQIANSDLWGSTFDATKFRLVDSGNGPSWIILENSALGYQFLISMSSNVPDYIRLALAPIATPFTGGSTTVSPASSAEVVVYSDGQGASAKSAIMDPIINTGGDQRLHITTCADDGQFWVTTSAPGSGIFQSVLGVVKTTNADPSDTKNTFLVWYGSRTALGAFENVNANNSIVKGLTPSGSVMTAGGFGPLYYYGNSPYTGTTDVLSGKYAAYQLEIMSISPQLAYRGTVPDLYSTGNPGVGNCVPSAAAIERVVVGRVLVPFIGGAPLV